LRKNGLVNPCLVIYDVCVIFLGIGHLNKILVSITLLIFFATSMFSSQSAFAGGVCFTDSDCTANDGKECTGPVECIAAICVQPPLTGTTCGSGPDPNGCSGQDFCLVGFCTANHVLPGISCDNGDGQVCTGACTGGGSCVTAPGTGESCDDGAQCTGGDICAAGECIGSPLISGVSCNNGDGQECTGACNAFGSCLTAPATRGSCDDGNSCTAGDRCSAGVCDPGVPLTGTDCGAGGTECSAQDTCQGGECIPNDLADGATCGVGGTECSAQDTCQAGTCIPNDEPNNTSCDDGELCTIGELCTDGVCGMGTVNPIPACFPDDDDDDEDDDDEDDDDEEEEEDDDNDDDD